MTKLRILTWNLLNGGIDDGDPDRLSTQLAFLKTLDLDVIALQEAKAWDELKAKKVRLAERELGMHGFLAPSAQDQCHLLLLAHQPKVQVIQEHHRIGTPFHHGLGHIQTHVQGYPHRLDIVDAHLAPASTLTRRAEAEHFDLLKERCILLGDFNAAPADGTPIAVPPDTPAAQARRKQDRRPAELIEEAGFIDIGAAVKDDTPTVGHHRTDRLKFRCDRIYFKHIPVTAVIEYHVITTVDHLSDHRPVLAVIDLTAT